MMEMVKKYALTEDEEEKEDLDKEETFNRKDKNKHQKNMRGCGLSQHVPNIQVSLQFY